MSNQLIKPIKKALAKEYGHKNVSVKNGTGTAWGWVEIRVSMPIPDNFCMCGGDSYSCEDHRMINSKVHNQTVLEIETKAIEALKAENLKPYSYTDDMGYDHSEMLVSVNYEKVSQ